MRAKKKCDSKENQVNKDKPSPHLFMRDRFIKAFNGVAVKLYGFPMELVITQHLEYDDNNEEVVFRATIINNKTHKTVVVQVINCRFWWRGISDDELVETVRVLLGMREDRARAELIKAGLIEKKEV